MKGFGHRVQAATLASAIALANILTLSACGGGGGGGGGMTPAPTPTPVGEANYLCPSADSPTSVTTGGTSGELARQFRKRGSNSQVYAPGLVAVSYDRAFLKANASLVASRETNLGANLSSELDFPNIGTTTRVLRVNPGATQSIMSSLQGQTGVRKVGKVGLRYPTVVSSPYFTNDPYFHGFTGTGPLYYEAAAIPGQWDMHAIKLEYAFAYSQSTDVEAPVTANGNALGKSSVKIAIIDTGEDTGHPELTSKIAYQKCFITDQNNSQSVSSFTTDPQGHGTDVSGIAAADLGNGLGFVGAGGNVMLDAYRVFPTPDSYANCVTNASTTTDLTCSAKTVDIASAINDAVSHGANVISLSLGGDVCSGGNDPDPTEGNAIANAIAAHVIVVAAAGNGGTSGVDAPACDPGVIAVGASGLADGTQNGTNSLGTPSSPIEYVASYSQYGSPASDLHSSSAWGIVAPGGDPNGGGDGDDLHWIENLWTSTPFDPNDAGDCASDFGTTSVIDCRVLIAGTSMATPHVAGAAALIESVTNTYSTPAAMKQFLCQTADDISDPHEGCGRLNIYRAMATAMNDPTLP